MRCCGLPFQIIFTDESGDGDTQSTHRCCGGKVHIKVSYKGCSTINGESVQENHWYEFCGKMRINWVNQMNLVLQLLATKQNPWLGFTLSGRIRPVKMVHWRLVIQLYHCGVWGSLLMRKRSIFLKSSPQFAPSTPYRARHIYFLQVAGSSCNTSRGDATALFHIFSF